MNYSLRGAGLAIAMLGVVGMAGAGQRPKVQPLGPVAFQKAVKESTYNVYPQIQDYKLQIPRRVMHEDEESVRWIDPGTANTLPLGGTTDESRVKLNSIGSNGSPLWPAIDATGWVPPDCTAAVSPGFVLATVNSDVAFFTRAGAKLFQQRLDGSSGFFGSLGAGDFVFDPKTFFDPLTKRFFLLAVELDDASKTSKVLIAVSDDDDPRGNWNKYRFEAKLVDGSNEYWLDYPGFGFNKDWVGVTGNMFAFSGSDGFGGVKVFAFNKANLIAGNTNGSVTFRADTFTIQLAKQPDPNQTSLFGMAVGTGSSMELWAIKGSSNPSLVTTSVTVPQWLRPSGPAPSTGGRQLDTLDGRILTAGFANGHLVATHTTQVSNGDSRAAARWYDVKVNGWPNAGVPTLFQSGRVTGTGNQHAFMPAIHVNAFGDISMTYTVSSPSITADIMIAGRKPSDPLGTMGAPKKLVSGSGVYGGAGGTNRWGDFFSVEVDPKNNRTFWGMAMSGQDNGSWLTHVNSWDISTGGDNAFTFNALTMSAYEGTLTSGTASSLWATDGNMVIINSQQVAKLGQAASVLASYKVTVKNPASLGVKIRLTGRANTTALVFFYNWKTAKYEHQMSFAIKSGPNDATVFTKGVPTDYLSSTGDFRVIVRTLAPIKANAMPTGFQAQFDLLQALGQ